jgi:glycine/D-amino acid oxidase-like deaminating enzyme
MLLILKHARCYGSALHLDRRAFDEALALAARDAGADLKLGCAARVAAQSQGGYIVQLSTGGRIRANAAILATGRAGGGFGLPYVRQYLTTMLRERVMLRSLVRRSESFFASFPMV